MGSLLRRPGAVLALIILAGGVLRFYNLGWGGPYHHFHIDEHFVFSGAIDMRRDFWQAALAPKFFMYSPLPMYLLIGLLEGYEQLVRPLTFVGIEDGTTLMVLGRGISAAFGTATIPIVYLIARRLAGVSAGLIAAALLAFSVIHIRESHFFTVDTSLTFFCALTLLLALRMAQSGSLGSYIAAGVALAGAVLCKYSAVFLVAVIGLAHLLAPGRVTWPGRPAPWARWVLKGALPLVVAAVTFLLLDPLVVTHYDKFRQDIAEWVTQPLSGQTRPIWGAQFTNIQPQLYWFTNLLWWGFGPALEIWGLLGFVWLATRRTTVAWIALAYPIAYFAGAGQTTLPFARYAVPFAPALAIAAGVLSADLLRRPRWRRAAAVATAIVIGSTGLYALAYMNVFRAPDARLEASGYLHRYVPQNARVLVEPSHNIPPTGRYLTEPAFDTDYVIWGAHGERHDYYRMYTLDTYRFLYDRRPTDAEKQTYIAQRLALADYIVMDDTFLQFYEHLPASEHGVVKRYYEQLFNGELGFELLKTFKVYPSLFGMPINDDGAELSFRLFDHPRVFVFMRMERRR
ncbi:MAG TPA: glycosyltransferase family 39 protein [Vicinamibacterales bacterium]|nr:glycosyltransferase family 39 protein [Vicinamibacterales bacterium]